MEHIICSFYKWNKLFSVTSVIALTMKNFGKWGRAVWLSYNYILGLVTLLGKMGIWPAKLKYELTFHWDCLSGFLEKHLYAGLTHSVLSLIVACPVGDKKGSLIWLHTLSFLLTWRQAKSQQESSKIHFKLEHFISVHFPRKHGFSLFLHSIFIVLMLSINLISLRIVKNRTLIWVAGFIYLPLKNGKFSKHRKCIRRTNHYTEEFGERMVTFFPCCFSCNSDH